MIPIVWILMPLLVAAVVHCLLLRKPWFSSWRTFLFGACWGIASGIVAAVNPCVELCEDYGDELLPAVAISVLAISSFVFLQYYTRPEADDESDR